MYETLVKFISSGSGPEPTPVPVPGPESVLTQTLDPFGILISVLLIVYAVASVSLLYVNRAYSHSSITGSSAKSRSFKKFAIGTVVSSVIVTFLLVVAFSSISLAKPASLESNSDIVITPSVNAVVNEETGDITIESSSIYNNTTSDYEITEISTTLSEGIEDPDSKWTLTIGQTDVYSGVAGNTKAIDPSIIIAGATDVTVSYALNMDVEFAKTLIDKDVLTVSFKITEVQPTPPPVLVANATVDLNGATPTAVAEKAFEDAGWELNEDKSAYIQEFYISTPVGDITNVFNTYLGYGEVVPPSGKIFDQWLIDPVGPVLLTDTTFTVSWKDAPSVNISGKVIDPTEKAVSGAAINLWSSSSALLASVLSEEDGTFTFKDVIRGSSGVIKIDTDTVHYGGLMSEDIIVKAMENIDLGDVKLFEKSVITGKLDAPGILVTYTVNGGGKTQTFTTMSDAHGYYWLPVPASTSGKLKFDGGDNYATLTFDTVTHEMGSHIEKNLSMTPVESLTTVTGTITPASEDCLVQYRRDDGALFDGIVDADTGNFSLALTPNSNGMLTIYNKSENALYTTSYTSKDPKSTEAIDVPAFSESYKLTIEKGTGIIDPDYLPLGYSRNDDNSLSANYVAGSDLEQIFKGIDKSRFWHMNGEGVLDDRELIMFTNSKGALTEETICTPCYWLQFDFDKSGLDAEGQGILVPHSENLGKICEHCYYEMSLNNSMFVYNPNDEFLFALVPHGKMDEQKYYVGSYCKSVIFSEPWAILTGHFDYDITFTHKWEDCNWENFSLIGENSESADFSTILNAQDVKLLEEFGFEHVYGNPEYLGLFTSNDTKNKECLKFLNRTNVFAHKEGSTFSSWAITSEEDPVKSWYSFIYPVWEE